MSKRCVWKFTEIADLISIVDRKNLMPLLKGKTRRNRTAYTIICDEMEKKGYNKTPEQIKIKFRALKQQYFECKRINAECGADDITVDHYNAMDKLMSSSRSVAAAMDMDTAMNESGNEDVVCSIVKDTKKDAAESKRCNWGYEETIDLLAIIKEKNIMPQLESKTRRNRVAYTIVSDEMKNRGYNKSPKQVRVKFNLLKQLFLEAYRENAKNGSRPILMEHYNQLNELLSSQTHMEDISMNSDTDNDIEENKEKKGNESCVWKPDETKELLAIMKEMTTLKGKFRRHKLDYSTICDEMKKKGYNKTLDQVTNKFRTLKQQFLETKQKNSRNGSGHISMEHYSDLEDLLSNRCLAAATIDMPTAMCTDIDDEDGDDDIENSNWNIHETADLLSILRKMSKLEGKKRRNRIFYSYICNELNKNGYDKTPEEVKLKFRSLKHLPAFNKWNESDDNISMEEDCEEICSIKHDNHDNDEDDDYDDDVDSILTDKSAAPSQHYVIANIVQDIKNSKSREKSGGEQGKAKIALKDLQDKVARVLKEQDEVFLNEQRRINREYIHEMKELLAEHRWKTKQILLDVVKNI